MTVGTVDFGGLLCSRLCHDLLSPVGALNNGLELLADETDAAMRQRCFDLLSKSARISANKLKFFRLAFGAGGGFGDRIDTRDARSAIEGLFADNARIELRWLVEEDALPKDAVKILLNLAMIAGEALARGGSIDIGAEQRGDELEVAIRIEGHRIVLEPEMQRILVEGGGTGEGVTSRTAPAYLVYVTAYESGGSVRVSTPADGVMIFGAVMRAR